MQQYGGGFGGYGPSQVYLGQGGYGRHTPNGGRDEILVCSDDRVFALRPAAPVAGQNHHGSQSMLSDASWTSIPQ